jgi:hypothetical protein
LWSRWRRRRGRESEVAEVERDSYGGCDGRGDGRG